MTPACFFGFGFVISLLALWDCLASAGRDCLFICVLHGLIPLFTQCAKQSHEVLFCTDA